MCICVYVYVNVSVIILKTKQYFTVWLHHDCLTNPVLLVTLFPFLYQKDILQKCSMRNFLNQGYIFSSKFYILITRVFQEVYISLYSYWQHVSDHFSIPVPALVLSFFIISTVLIGQNDLLIILIFIYLLSTLFSMYIFLFLNRSFVLNATNIFFGLSFAHWVFVPYHMKMWTFFFIISACRVSLKMFSLSPTPRLYKYSLHL